MGIYYIEQVYLMPYVYSFYQIFQALRLFPSISRKTKKITWHFLISAVWAGIIFSPCLWQLWQPKQLLMLAMLAGDILASNTIFFQINSIDLKASGKKNEKKRKFANFSWWALVGFFLHPPFYIHVQKLPGFKVNFSLFLTVNCKKWRYLLLE